MANVTGLLSLSNSPSLLNASSFAFNSTILTNVSALDSPNFVYCDSYYGRGIAPRDLNRAERSVALGENPVDYLINRPTAQWHLPFSSSAGSASIAVEVAGPADARLFRISPNAIHILIQILLSQCVVERGQGGFATTGIEDVVEYITDPSEPFDRFPWPDHTAFLTVTVSRPVEHYPAPGDFDPQTARRLMEAMSESPDIRELGERYALLDVQAIRMRQGGFLRWWDWGVPDAAVASSAGNKTAATGVAVS